MAISAELSNTHISPRSQRRAVLRLGMPAVGEQLLNLMVGLVDTYAVGHLSLAVAATMGYDATLALASVSLAAQLSWTLTTLFMAVALGCTVIVARFVGAGDWLMANKTLRQSLVMAAAMGLLGWLVVWGLAPIMMDGLKASEHIKPLGIQYLRIATLAFPLQAIMYVGNAALRGSGDTRTPLIAMGLVNVINAVLSLILVNGWMGIPGMGIAGAAWGTAIGQTVGSLLVITWLLRGRSGLKLDRIPRPDPALMWRILRQGLPFGAEQFVFQGALIFFVRFIMDLGETAYAAHNTVITIESISFLPGFGIAVAATTLVGQSMGAGKPELARASAYEAFFVAALMMGAIGVLFIAFPEAFLRFFIADEAIVQAGAMPLRMVGFAQPALAANFIFSGALRGGGDPHWPLYTKIVCAWGIRLPLAYYMVYHTSLGLNGIWIAMITDFACIGTLAWWRFRQGKWRFARV